MSIQLNYLLPAWLTLLLIAALLGALVYAVLTMLQKQVPPKWLSILSSLRLAIFAAFILILLQPVISYTRTIPQLPELLILIDTSQSMGKPSGIASSTRLQEVATALSKSELTEALKGRYRLQWSTFDGTATPREEADLATLKPAGASTQFAESIESACNQARALGKNPQRLLLVSDGNDLGQTDPVEVARRFGLTVDVLAPTAAAPSDTPAIEIAEVQSARRVLLGSDTHFRVTLQGKQPAAKNHSLVLRVTEDGKKIMDHPVVMQTGRSEQQLMLTYRPGAAGLKQYEFRLAAGKEETAKPYPLTVQVLDSKYEVLILEDRWRWEYKYLHRLFEDDPSFRFSALLARGGGTFVQFASPDRRVNLVGFPQSRADLEGFDIFVLGDVNPSQWPRGLASDLARQITDGGKSLVVVAGPSLGRLLELPELQGILPVELTPDSGKPMEGPIDVRLRPDSSSSPFFFQLRGQDAEKLPPVDQIYPVLRKRPGATVLLEAAKQRNPYGNLIVIAEQTVGRGQVLFVGTDTLWKWHTLASTADGPTPYSIFWQQAFRTMTPARSNVGAVNLWLTPSRSRSEVGRTLVVQAEVQSQRPVAPANLQAEVTLPDGKHVPVVFTTDPANPRLYRAEFACAQPGLHRITTSLLAEGKLLAEGTAAIQADEPYGENAAIGIDLNNLARIARDTGGQVVDPARSDTWPSPEKSSLGNIQQFYTLDLWNNFTLLLVLCVLLAADWFIRLFKGFVAG